MWNPRIILENRNLLALSTGLLGCAIGATASYVVLSKRLEQKYASLSEVEIAEAKTFYSRVHKTGDFANPEDLIDAATALSIKEKYSAPNTEVVNGQEVIVVDEFTVRTSTIKAPEPEPEEEAPENRNVFGDPDAQDEWDYDLEIMQRGDEPYVIHKDEFEEGKEEHEQIQLTYYEGDDVLCDSQDQPIPNSDNVVLDANLMKFGHGSEDPSIVYIRNDAVQADFEVLKSEGKYTKEVLGFDDTLQHSERPRRFRDRSADE